MDTNGEMISCSNKKIIGNQIIKWSENLKERKKAYGEFINNSKIIDTKAYTIDVVYDESFQADIVHVAIQEDLISKMNEQQKIMILLLGVITLVLATMIYTVTRNLMSSINHLVDTMKVAGHGKLSVRAIENPKSPTEIQILETNFNSMLDKLESSIKNEKEASMKQKNAEIKALEAQINPHFLYNSLDTINWMAIDRDDYEISNAITALATILRYGIDHSNDVVELGREVEWLKQYLFLQQTRLKNTFECEINISEETKSFKIHKLLFQPFVENSILHGFEAKKSLYTLKIRIAMKNDNLVIQIWDNGKGMPVDLVERMNQGVFLENKDRQCIGMENAITRLKMYYGEEATVFISSQLGEYTNVIIQIPGQ